MVAPAGDLLTALAGTWEGPGAGHYPTIAPFDYREQLTFTRLGDKPVLHYAQRTWHTDDPRGLRERASAGEPVGGLLHVECGYVRVDGAQVELVLAQPTGFAETHTGWVDDGVVAFGLTSFGRVATAQPVQTLRRRWALVDGALHVDLWMSFAGAVDAHHLHAELRRPGSSTSGGAGPPRGPGTRLRDVDQPPAGPTGRRPGD